MTENIIYFTVHHNLITNSQYLFTKLIYYKVFKYFHSTDRLSIEITNEHKDYFIKDLVLISIKYND